MRSSAVATRTAVMMMITRAGIGVWVVVLSVSDKLMRQPRRPQELHPREIWPEMPQSRPGIASEAAASVLIAVRCFGTIESLCLLLRCEPRCSILPALLPVTRGRGLHNRDVSDRPQERREVIGSARISPPRA